MWLNENLNGKKVQDLINDKTFINALVPKLAAGDGNNGVYTKKGVGDELAKKADKAALITKANTEDVYTKTTADNTFVKIVDFGTKAVAEKVLAAEDGNKSILVEKLGKFLLLVINYMIMIQRQQRSS